jgi:hypothetical protein
MATLRVGWNVGFHGGRPDQYQGAIRFVLCCQHKSGARSRGPHGVAAGGGTADGCR